MEGGGWLLLILDVVGGALLAGALIFGVAMWRKRPKSPAAARRREDGGPRELSTWRVGANNHRERAPLRPGN